MSKLEFWKLEIKFRNLEKMEFRKLGIKFGNRNFEELFKDGILKINKWINKNNNNNNENNNDLVNKCENWNIVNWKLNLEIGNLKNYLKMEF